MNLINFAETKELARGVPWTISFSIPKEDKLFSDAHAKKTASGSYILEAGEYTISVRSDAHTEEDTETFTMSSDIAYSTNDRSCDISVGTNHF